MNIFEYLKDDEAHIERRLKSLTAHCPEWSQDKVFDESVKLFAAITIHLEKKETLLTSYIAVLDDRLYETIEQATMERIEIESVIDGMTLMHIDEPEFQTRLELLLRKLINHRKFCQEHLYPEIASHLSKSERQVIDAKFAELVFG